jgi:redox-sensitive bicupin YhaK (pirin superfamily)
MLIKRELIKVNTPGSQLGFLGAGHIACPVMINKFSKTDPFILLMDDVLDKKNEKAVGGPQLHAGFEAVTLVLQGELGHGANKMKPGDFELMTAGSGIIHNETIDKIVRRRILQLWLTLPKKDRWVTPRIQNLPAAHAPKKFKNGVHIQLYSGSSAGLTSPIQNYVPLIVADIEIARRVTTIQEIPAYYNSFLYVLRGSVKIGEEEKLLNEGEVGWLNALTCDAQSELNLTAGEEGVRFVLFAAKPHGENIVAYGPFIGDTSEDINRLNQEYRRGRMRHISTIPETQRVIW